MRWMIENTIPGRVRLAHFVLTDVTVRAGSEALQEEILQRGEQLRAEYDEPAQAAGILQPSRRLYHSLGIDPSKRRPSSEALIRRILQGKGLYEVNTAVDAANLTSILHLRSVGLYDADHLDPELLEDAGPSNETHRQGEGDGSPGPGAGEGSGEGSSGRRARVALRLGLDGEGYDGIRKDRINLAGRPGLFDRKGPFGNPSADSSRTMVTLETRRLLYVLFEPADASDEGVRERLELALDVMMRHLGGTAEDLTAP